MLPFHKRPSSQRCSCAAIPAWPAACPPPASWWVSGEPGCEALGCTPSGSVSWYSPAPNCPTPPSSKAPMGPNPAKPRLKRGRRGCLESKRKPSWCLVPPPPNHQRMIVHSQAIAETLCGGYRFPSHIKYSPLNEGVQAPVYLVTGLRSPRILVPRSLH